MDNISAGRVSSRTYVFPVRVGRGYGPGWTVVVVVVVSPALSGRNVYTPHYWTECLYPPLLDGI